jgi:thiamine biosynthesis lipoprotein
MEVAELHGHVMGSRLHIITVDTAPTRSAKDRLDAAMQQALVYLEHLEQRWSRFISTSDISRINQLGPAGGTIDVDPSTLTLLATMVDGYERTAGRYDPTILRALIAEGYHASRVDPTMFSVIAPPADHPRSLHDLELDAAANTVTVPSGLVIDPGGIGKGLAADLAVARLLDEKIDGAMVEIGGDLATAGTPVDPVGWLVDVEHPDADDGLLCRLVISGGGVATSSVRSRRWTRDGVERHHQIDPGTGICSTTDLTAVTVGAPTGWLAEVHATAALAAGSDHSIAYLDGHGLTGIAVATTATDEYVWATSDLEDVQFDLRRRVS